MKKLLLILCIIFSANLCRAQYPPQVGLPGCTAIPDTSSAIKAWATNCVIHRGYIDIDSPALGFTTSGDSSMAIGAADHSVVSLGDSGVAVLGFPGFIFDGPGPDFAVFENGFANYLNDSQAFLELAFVEVSSDGINYTRFPAQSLTPLNVQIPGSGVYMYANLINNLAGKYIGGYGTPFDLNELAGTPGLDINHITNIRVVDVVGTVMGPHASHDAGGRIINDPFPTNFATGGFDLDAVAVLHISGDAGVANTQVSSEFSVYPNPMVGSLFIENRNNISGARATITTPEGKITGTTILNNGTNEIKCASYPAGLYFVTVETTDEKKCTSKVVKY